jgi:hypothetical protein
VASRAGKQLTTTLEQPVPFSLLGGPLHRIGRRLGLVHGTNTVRLGLALGCGLWLVVVVLALAQGIAGRLFSMSVVGGHARLLLVIPLFFICESWVGPRMTAFVATIARTGIVPRGAQAALDREVTRSLRRVNAWWPEAVCLLAAIGLEVTGSRLQTYGATGANDPSRTALAAIVYFRVGLTLFRFLLFRWAWKLTTWSWFLWRVSRLDLILIPGHPDRAGGLGPLEGVHERFTPLVALLSVIECASLAESISTGTLAVSAVYPWLAIVLLVDGALFIGPLLVFTDKLWASRTKGVGLYMALAASYVTAFEAKWTAGHVPAGEPLLGTQDLQALADLDNAVSVVKGMRWITAGPRLLTMMTTAAIVPLAPLLLFKYPLAELAQKFFSKLVGL